MAKKETPLTLDEEKEEREKNAISIDVATKTVEAAPSKLSAPQYADEPSNIASLN